MPALEKARLSGKIQRTRVQISDQEGFKDHGDARVSNNGDRNARGALRISLQPGDLPSQNKMKPGR